jgi:hypothetical protein
MPALLVDMASGLQADPALPASLLLLFVLFVLLSRPLLLLLFDRTTVNLTALPPARPPRLLMSSEAYSCCPASSS